MLTPEAQWVSLYHFSQSSRDFACYLVQTLLTRMQQGQRLMQWPCWTRQRAVNSVLRWWWGYTLKSIIEHFTFNWTNYLMFSFSLVFSHLSSASELSDSNSSFSSCASTIILDEVSCKRQRINNTATVNRLLQSFTLVLCFFSSQVSRKIPYCQVFLNVHFSLFCLFFIFKS